MIVVSTSMYTLFILSNLVDNSSFYSHAVHRILAVWALGADGAIIQAGYDTDSSYLRETYPSPNPISAENFKDHLMDHK